MKKWFIQYWGLAALALLLFAWTRDVGPGSLLLLSGLVTVWGAFRAPVPCYVPNRAPKGTFCKNNAHGLLMGCHLSDHKLQKFKGGFYSDYWHAFRAGEWPDRLKAGTAALAIVLGIVTGIGTVVDWII